MMMIVRLLTKIKVAIWSHSVTYCHSIILCPGSDLWIASRGECTPRQVSYLSSPSRIRLTIQIQMSKVILTLLSPLQSKACLTFEIYLHIWALSNQKIPVQTLVKSFLCDLKKKFSSQVITQQLNPTAWPYNHLKLLKWPKKNWFYPQVFAGVWTASAFKVWQTLQGMQWREKSK